MRESDGGGKHNDLISITQSLLFILSWVSHNTTNLPSLADRRLISVLVRIIGEAAGGHAKVGRMLRRLARSDALLEQLLDLDYHLLIADGLCRAPCLVRLNAAVCDRCHKVAWVGTHILADLATSVDSAYGFGILQHRYSVHYQSE